MEALCGIPEPMNCILLLPSHGQQTRNKTNNNKQGTKQTTTNKEQDKQHQTRNKTKNKDRLPHLNLLSPLCICVLLEGDALECEEDGPAPPEHGSCVQ